MDKLRSWVPWTQEIKPAIPMSEALERITTNQVLQVRFSDPGHLDLDFSDGRQAKTQLIPGSQPYVLPSILNHVRQVSYQPRTSKRTKAVIQTALPFLLIFVWYRAMRSLMNPTDKSFYRERKTPLRWYEKLYYFFFQRYFNDNKRPSASPRSVQFADIISKSKHQVMEIVECLKKPSEFEKFGASLPKGVLLVGPSGTGKTMVAKAVAAEANVPFLSCSASDFVEIFVGKGAHRVRQLFAKARDRAPCILFIDELDALGSRGPGDLVLHGSGHDETVQTINQLLSEIDGFEESTAVVVMAATNRLSAIDPALLRGGRFDRWIYFHLPSQEEREEILRVSSRKRNIKLSESAELSLPGIAAKAAGLSGADLDSIINESSFRAHRRVTRIPGVDRMVGPDGNREIMQEDLEEAVNHYLVSRGRSVPTVLAAFSQLPADQGIKGSQLSTGCQP